MKVSSNEGKFDVITTDPFNDSTGHFEVTLANAVGKTIEGVEVQIFLGHGATSAQGESKKRNSPVGSKATSLCQFDQTTKVCLVFHLHSH